LLLKRYVSPLFPRNWKNQSYIRHKADHLTIKEVKLALAALAPGQSEHLRCHQVSDKIVSIEHDHCY
jgi:hypothetical protein